MANNELSGPSLLVFLSKYIEKKIIPNFSYRIIFVPETIGTICYINENLKKLKKNVIAGFNLSCIGDERNYSYLKTREEKTLSNEIAKHVLKNLFKKYKIFSWLDRGSDERQYNLPGVDIPVGTLMRTRFGDYREYHTSLDNFNLVSEKGLNGGYKIAKKAIEIIQKKIIPFTHIACEPMISKRNLQPKISTGFLSLTTKNIKNFLAYSDGKNDLKEISKQTKIKNNKLKKIYNILIKKNLIKSL